MKMFQYNIYYWFQEKKSYLFYIFENTFYYLRTYFKTRPTMGVTFISFDMDVNIRAGSADSSVSDPDSLFPEAKHCL